jgi:putative transposase
LSDGLSAHERIERLFERGGVAGLTLAEQVALLGVSRSSLYYVPRLVNPTTLDVMNRIDKIHTDWPTYGQRTIAAQLTRDLGTLVGRDWVRNLMREMGIEAIYQKPNLSKNGKEHPRFPYLLRHITADHPNHIWSTDITYIKMRSGFVYLVAFIDWFSRYILSWRISTTLDIEFVLKAAQEAIDTYGNPEYENSDQGSHFTSLQYIDIWDQEQTQISMDGRGRCMDNIIIERFWRTVKYEEVYLKEYATAWEAEQSIGDYLRRYNMERLHESLGYKTPAEVYYKK